ncbi:hypothetical protein [Nannocystis bainbridge]|uniref:Ig-like domain (Group 2) n=1 Tax=Nannocystis bainbridge TaxID=2995303 RepID=A0ABT5DST1_9BACT|nr:hypothetical protein [Nannocystis bainbridge]MDC0716696.1 hypothetical protein [Nannocystis bainbridge]
MSSRPCAFSRPLLLAGLLALGGCLDDCSDAPYDPQPGPGELGNGEFHFRCIGADDPACPTGESVGDFPVRVAVGARFALDYTWNEDLSRPPPELRTGAAERLSLKAGIFTAVAAGHTAVLALLPDSAIGDLIHVFATRPATLAIQHQRVDYDAYTLAAGSELELVAIARDTDRYVLAGLLAFTFEVADDGVVEVVGTGDGHVIVRAVAAGSTTVKASLGDLVAELALTVESGEPPLTTTDATSDSTTDESTTDASTTDASTTDATSDGTTDASTGDSTSDTTGGAL